MTTLTQLSSEVQRQLAERAVLEAEQLVGFAFIQPVHLGDAVADLNDVADLILRVWDA